MLKAVDPRVGSMERRTKLTRLVEPQDFVNGYGRDERYKTYEDEHLKTDHLYSDPSYMLWLRDQELAFQREGADETVLGSELPSRVAGDATLQADQELKKVLKPGDATLARLGD